MMKSKFQVTTSKTAKTKRHNKHYKQHKLCGTVARHMMKSARMSWIVDPMSSLYGLIHDVDRVSPSTGSNPGIHFHGSGLVILDLLKNGGWKNH